jgi:hypothetical protein
MTHAAARIFPIFNRCVIFAATDYTYHGHPEPLAFPPGRTRRSLALHYYTNGRPEQERSIPASSPPTSSLALHRPPSRRRVSR